MKKFLFLCVMAYAAVLSAAVKVDIDIDKPEGIYRTGEKVKFTVTLTQAQKFTYTLKFENKVVKSETLEYQGTPVVIEETSLRPGWLYLGIELLDENGKARRDMPKHRAKPTVVNEIGVMFEPDKIRAVPSRPDDFDRYWQNCRTELDKVPLNAELKEVSVPEKYPVRCFAVKVDCFGKRPVSGYLAYPRNAGKGKLMAQVDFLSLTWEDASKNAAIHAAARGALAFFATWHGGEVGQPTKTYRNDPVTGNKAYIARIVDNREEWFFRDMFFRVMRALDFVKSREEWDGENLIVQGGSLGGAQTIAAAALDPGVTLAVISVPALCELNAAKADRTPGLPYRGKPFLDKILNDPVTQQTAAYFDMVNFASKIKCEVFVCTGFTDETCFPSNVYAFYNALPAGIRKTMSTNPRTGHFGTTKNVQGNKRLQELFSGVTVH